MTLRFVGTVYEREWKRKREKEIGDEGEREGREGEDEGREGVWYRVGKQKERERE